MPRYVVERTFTMGLDIPLSLEGAEAYHPPVRAPQSLVRLQYHEGSRPGSLLPPLTT